MFVLCCTSVRVVFCLAFNTLWDFVEKYLFTLSHLRLHLHWVRARKTAPQRPTTIITHNNFFSIKKKKCVLCKNHVKNKPKKKPQWNSLAVFMYEKISFPHMLKPLAHMCQLARCSFKKKGFLFCARSYLIEALQAQALTLCHMSWTGSFLGLFINRQAGAVHLG